MLQTRGNYDPDFAAGRNRRHFTPIPEYGSEGDDDSEDEDVLQQKRMQRFSAELTAVAGANVENKTRKDKSIRRTPRVGKRDTELPSKEYEINWQKGEARHKGSKNLLEKEKPRASRQNSRDEPTNHRMPRQSSREEPTSAPRKNTREETANQIAATQTFLDQDVEKLLHYEDPPQSEAAKAYAARAERLAARQPLAPRQERSMLDDDLLGFLDDPSALQTRESKPRRRYKRRDEDDEVDISPRPAYRKHPNVATYRPDDASRFDPDKYSGAPPDFDERGRLTVPRTPPAPEAAHSFTQTRVEDEPRMSPGRRGEADPQRELGATSRPDSIAAATDSGFSGQSGQTEPASDVVEQEELFAFIKSDDGAIVGPIKIELADEIETIQQRTYRSTVNNDASSRSHSLFNVSVDSRDADEPACFTKRGKITFVDLAGSERGAGGQSQQREAQAINRSLLVLGKCLLTLSNRSPAGHVPYRDSKLTKLLADSLGGQSATLMIACVSPSPGNVAETLNTLRYAGRARNVKGDQNTSAGEKMDPMEQVMLSLRQEMKELRDENSQLKLQLAENGPMKSQSQPLLSHGRAEPEEEEGQVFDMLQEYMLENETLKQENLDLLGRRRNMEESADSVTAENDALKRRLEKLEKIVRAQEAAKLQAHESSMVNQQTRPSLENGRRDTDLSLDIPEADMFLDSSLGPTPNASALSRGNQHVTNYPFSEKKIVPQKAYGRGAPPQNSGLSTSTQTQGKPQLRYTALPDAEQQRQQKANPPAVRRKAPPPKLATQQQQNPMTQSRARGVTNQSRGYSQQTGYGANDDLTAELDRLGQEIKSSYAW